MKLPPFDYSRPLRLEEALSSVGGAAVPIVGGTELLGAMALGLLQPAELVSLRSVPELQGIEVVDGVLHIGATATHREVMASPLVRRHAPLLADVVRTVGNARVRSVGTLGGNLAFAEPRSDVLGALIALRADVVVSGTEASRRMPVAELVRGAYETDLRPGELIVRIEVDADGVDVGLHRKVVFTERPLVSVLVARRVADGRWRAVLAALGDEPVVADVDQLADLDVEALVAAADVTADHTGSEEYKRHLAGVTLRRAITDAERRSGLGE